MALIVSREYFKRRLLFTPLGTIPIPSGVMHSPFPSSP